MNYLEQTSEIIALRPASQREKGAINGFALIFWIGAAIDAISSPHVPTAPVIVRLLAGTIWLTGFVFIASNFIWIIFGQQVAQINSDQFKFYYQLGPFVVGKKRVFRVADVKNMKREVRTFGTKTGSSSKNFITFENVSSGSREELFRLISNEQTEYLLSGPLKRFVGPQVVS